MPFGAIGGAVAGGLASGIGGSLVSGLLSPSASGGTNGSGGYYVPTGLSYGDQSWQQLLGQELGAQGNINATAAGYGPNYQANANNAAAGYDWLGTSLLPQQSQQAYGTQNALLNAGQQVYQNSLDPNQAQYNLSLNNLMQQTGATNSMYGLGSSAAGAGVQNQALSNFGINWNTQQLQNQIAGLGAYTGAASEAGQYGQYGTALAEAAPGYQLQAGQLPYNTGMTIAGAPLASAQSIQSGIIPYMNNGQGAQQIPFQSQAAGAGAAGSMVSQGLSTAFSNLFPASYAGDFSTSTPSSTSGFYDPSLFGPSGYGGGYSYGGGGTGYGFSLQ